MLRDCVTVSNSFIVGLVVPYQNCILFLLAQELDRGESGTGIREVPCHSLCPQARLATCPKRRRLLGMAVCFVGQNLSLEWASESPS